MTVVTVARGVEIPAVVTQSVNIKGCLACVKSEKYVALVTLRPLGSMRQGEADLCTGCPTIK